MNESRSPDQHQVPGFWLWESLASSLVALISLVAVFLRVPEPGRTIIEWTLLSSAIASGIGNTVLLVQTTRADPVKRLRVERAWHTVGMRILVGGGVAAIAGMFVVYASLVISERGGHIPDFVTVPATVVAGIGCAVFIIGLVTFIIEDTIRDSRWPDGWR